MTVPINTMNTSNYGMLSEISKDANRLLGDNTGRSVSLRTAQGFKEAHNMPDMHENDAEHIVHAGMIFALFGSKFVHKDYKGFVFIVFVLLIIYYVAGRNQPKYSWCQNNFHRV